MSFRIRLPQTNPTNPMGRTCEELHGLHENACRYEATECGSAESAKMEDDCRPHPKIDRNNHRNIAMTWAPEGKRKKGRPKTTWRRTVAKESREAGWSSWDEARVTAADTKINGGTLWRPYVPPGAQKIGNR